MDTDGGRRGVGTQGVEGEGTWGTVGYFGVPGDGGSVTDPGVAQGPHGATVG